MKALDTPVLLAILHGDRKVRDVIRKLRGEEVATTELNLLELYAILSRGPAKSRSHRRDALDRLRGGLTVLAFDSRAAERAARAAARGDLATLSPILLGVLATLEANGCEDFLTTDPGSVKGRWPFHLTKVSVS